MCGWWPITRGRAHNIICSECMVSYQTQQVSELSTVVASWHCPDAFQTHSWEQHMACEVHLAESQGSDGVDPIQLCHRLICLMLQLLPLLHLLEDQYSSLLALQPCQRYFTNFKVYGTRRINAASTKSSPIKPILSRISKLPRIDTYLYSNSWEKFEPGPGFEPRTSSRHKL